MQDARKYIATINNRGQVTIPVEVRQHLNLVPQDKVIFRLTEGNRVEVVAFAMTLEEAYGSVPALNRSEDFDTIQQIVREERAARWLDKLNE